MLLVLGGSAGLPAQAQDLLADALRSFPANTFRVEYASAARLRRLPNYAALHRRYLGPRLSKLEEALRQLGIKEEDVDELITGWAAVDRNAQATVSAPGETGTDIYGLAAGRFDAERMTREAADHGVSPTELGSQPGQEGQPAGASRSGYCLPVGSVSTCVVLFGESHGAFGPRGLLSSIIESRENRDALTLGSDQRFASLIREAQTDAPIWGAATGAAIPETVAGWLPGQQNLQLNWQSVFRDVSALTYALQVTDQAQLRVAFNCTTDEAALNLRQVLEGVRVFQQIAWQNQNPNQPNPFGTLEIATQGDKVQLQLATSLAALGPTGPQKMP